MDHTNAVFDGVHGVLKIDFLSFVEDLTGGLLFNGEDNFHQCGFSCAVLANNGMDLTFFEFDVDVFVGYRAVGVDLGYVLQLQDDIFHIFTSHL